MAYPTDAPAPRGSSRIKIDAELFQTLVETMTDAIAILAPDGTVQYMSPASERLSGYPASARIGRPVLEQVHPDDRQRLGALMTRARFDRLPFGRIEYRLRHADGTWRYIESHGRSMRPSDPESCWVIVSHDITHRHETIEALRTSEQRFESLVEHAAFGIYHTTPDGRILDANPAFASMLGYDSMDDVLALNMSSDVWLHPEARPQLLPDASGTLKEIEVQWKRRDGSPMTVRLRGRAIHGDPIVYETFAEDVTQQRLLEEQIQQSQKMEAIGRLAGGIAHDFNNLLSSILGYAELLAEQIPAGDPRLDDVKEIRKSGERASALTRQLLAYSRRQVLQPRELDLNQVLTGVRGLLHSALGSNIDFQIHLEEGLPAVLADPSQIEQVLTNLVVNAREGMPDGGKLVIETARGMLDAGLTGRLLTPAQGQYVMLVVSDTGKGLDADAKARIFEPFFSTKSRGRGAGLGLATVYGIVKQSGGYIWVYSEPGMGTTFKVYLPVATSGRSVPTAPGDEAPMRQDGTETILLVEDDEPVRELARRVLRRFGYQVLVAANADEAMVVFERHAAQIQLLLTDIIMPQTSGLELASRLKALKPELHVVYMSGFTEDAFANRGPYDPKITLIHKPFTQDLLAAKVRQVLDRQ
jgi:PAS domain S-box-containing protein